MPDRSVAIVIHGGVQALDVEGPVDVFAEANGVAYDYDVQQHAGLRSSRKPQN